MAKSSRNRTAGNNYERFCVKRLKENGVLDVVTSRAESRNMDNRGVDIFGPSIPYHIQCKNTIKDVKYHDLLTEERLPTDKPLIIFHKRTEKRGKVFRQVGEYVIMKYETFNTLCEVQEISCD
tara:strand:+ start:2981 stop:3349 length:369 start_codon:yes stop_codon:yes gene_type:complete